MVTDCTRDLGCVRNGRMKILAVTSASPWPPVHGAAIRNGLLLEMLASEHEVDLVYLKAPHTTETLSPSSLGRVVGVVAKEPSLSRRVAVGLRQGVPDLLVRHASWSLRGRVQMLLTQNRYEVVHVAQAQLAPLVQDVKSMFPEEHSGPHVVYDAHNVEWMLQEGLSNTSRGLRRLWARRQKSLLAKVESWLAQTADLVLASSLSDKSAFELLGGRSVLHLPHPILPKVSTSESEVRNEQPTFLFAANFFYRPNVLAADWLFASVWKKVLRKIPEAQLRIVGPGSENLRNGLPVRASIGGTVDDIDSEYHRAWVAVSPTAVAAGAPYKVLSALAAKRPVVVRKSGYVGLPTASDIGVAMTSTADNFANELIRLVTDAVAYESAVTLGVEYLEKFHSVDVLRPLILDAYAHIGAPEKSGVDS